MLKKGDQPYMIEKAWADAQAFKPDVVVIKLGTNDSKPQNWQYKNEFQKDLEQMIQALRPARILLCTPVPALKSSWDISESVIANEIIPIQRKVAKKYGLQVVDLHTLFTGDGAGMLDDGIHPDGKGVRRMAEIIADAIKTK
jgi:lysophospholipase L1-like esterase